ncbi:hypothetical protein KKE26_09360 [bacterium]|nr:hypothetical protein [bacterium]
MWVRISLGEVRGGFSPPEEGLEMSNKQICRNVKEYEKWQEMRLCSAD